MPQEISAPQTEQAKIEVRARQPYRTAWFLQDQTNIDAQIYGVINDFMLRTRAFRHKELWAKYAVFLYVAGRRRTEPFLSNPFVQKILSGDKVYYKVISVNEKHFEGRRLRQPQENQAPTGKKKRQPVTETIYRPHRRLLPAIFRAWNPYETALFEFLLAGNDQASLDFTPLLQARKPRPEEIKHFRREIYSGRDKVVDKLMSNISKSFRLFFRADITNGSRKITQGGMVPHMMRHLRTYNLLIEKNLEDWMVQRLLGWDGVEEVWAYPDVKNAVREREEISEYERMDALIRGGIGRIPGPQTPASSYTPPAQSDPVPG